MGIVVVKSFHRDAHTTLWENARMFFIQRGSMFYRGFWLLRLSKKRPRENVLASFTHSKRLPSKKFLVDWYFTYWWCKGFIPLSVFGYWPLPAGRPINQTGHFQFNNVITHLLLSKIPIKKLQLGFVWILHNLRSVLSGKITHSWQN